MEDSGKNQSRLDVNAVKDFLSKKKESGVVSTHRDDSRKRIHRPQKAGNWSARYDKRPGPVKRYTQEEIMAEQYGTHYEARLNELNALPDTAPSSNFLVGLLATQHHLTAAELFQGFQKITSKKVVISVVHSFLSTVRSERSGKPIRHLIETLDGPPAKRYRLVPPAVQLSLRELSHLARKNAAFGPKDAIAKVPDLAPYFNDDGPQKQPPPPAPASDTVEIPNTIDVNVNINVTINGLPELSSLINRLIKVVGK